jgi:hypothetical protein
MDDKGEKPMSAEEWSAVYDGFIAKHTPITRQRIDDAMDAAMSEGVAPAEPVTAPAAEPEAAPVEAVTERPAAAPKPPPVSTGPGMPESQAGTPGSGRAPARGEAEFVNRGQRQMDLTAELAPAGAKARAAGPESVRKIVTLVGATMPGMPDKARDVQIKLLVKKELDRLRMKHGKEGIEAMNFEKAAREAGYL